MPEAAPKKKFTGLIAFVSIVIPVVVALLFFMPKIEGYDFSFLPPIYATINALTAVTLVAAVMAIRKGNRKNHERLMRLAIVFSLLFLVGYIIYHSTMPATKYGGDGAMKYVYFFLLVSHIVLSVVVVPLVLISYIRALSERFDKHKKIAKITFPIWLYVAITGVVVYLMISPYYA